MSFRDSSSKELHLINKQLKDSGYKICTVCKDKKIINDFYLQNRIIKGKKYSYPSSICRKCDNKRGLCPIKNRSKKYKISKEEVINLLKNTKCPICNYEFVNDQEKCIDHCHNKLKVRDILCHKCNTALGLINENIDIAKSMIKYIKKHQ